MMKRKQTNPWNNKGVSTIYVMIYRSASGDIYRVRARNHSESVVCAAVSALLINTVNSLEEFTDVRLTVQYQQEGGYLDFAVSDMTQERGKDNAQLLLKSMLFGLKNIQREYEGSLYVEEEISC